MSLQGTILSRKKASRAVWVLLLCGAAAAVALYAVLSRETVWYFQETDRILDNPDRGFYIQIDSRRADKIPDAADEVRVILLAFDIEAFSSGDLPQEKLDELREALDVAAREHVSVVFRAAYGFQKEAAEPDRIGRMGRHIEQMAEVLNCYADQILVVQAGMLGSYGEWHSSRYLEGTDEQQRESRLYILGQWEAALSPQIQVDVRRPRFIREAAEAGILSGRLGIHNDALLSTDSDMGTYDAPGMEREDELVWMREHLTRRVNGGEMPVLGAFSLPENADREFSMMHTGYLNLKYNKEVIAYWDTIMLGEHNAKRYLENHLGYRLFVTELGMRQLHFPGELYMTGIKIRLKLCNTGYAPLPEPYQVFLAVSAGGECIYQKIQMPALYDAANGGTAEAEVRIKLPMDFVQGKDTLEIGFKIARSEDVEDGKDCVELAHEGGLYRDGINAVAVLERTKGIFRARPLAEEIGREQGYGSKIVSAYGGSVWLS